MQGEHELTVAIVEDDPILVFLYREVCKAAGWRVIGEAARVSEALDLLSRETPDLLLLDYSLQGQNDGIELLGALTEHWPEIHTTLITGWDIETLAARIDYIEPHSILKKPVTPAVLTEHLQECRAKLAPNPMPNNIVRVV